MRSGWTPSIVPNGRDETVYIVEDDFGAVGRAYVETDVDYADLESIIQLLTVGYYSDPIRIVSFNVAERWSADVSEAIIQEIQRRHDVLGKDLPAHLKKFINKYALGKPRLVK